MKFDSENSLEYFLKDKAIKNRGKNIVMETIGEFTIILEGKILKIELLKNTINGEVMHNVKKVHK